MNIKPILLILIFSCSAVLISCDKNDNGDSTRDVQASLQRVADSVYNDFHERWGIEQGGINIYISGPSGNFQASSNISPASTAGTHFRVASITKTFTAASIMKLHQEGKLDINDFISDYIPNTPAYDIPYRDQITIKLLLQHRSGVFDVSNNAIPETVNAPYANQRYEDYMRDQDDHHTFTFDELVGINAEHQLSTAAPDVGFFYSNTGYNILGKIIEEVSGISYSDFIDQEFVIPLGLTGTYSPWNGNDTEMRTPYVTSYLHIIGEGIYETPENNVSVHVTEGNIVSTPKDITTWIRLLISGNAGINAGNVAKMKEMLTADAGHGVYGLGLVYDEGLGYGHNGIHLSHVSALRYNPDNDISVLASANFIRMDPSDTNSVFDLGFAVRNALLPTIKAYQK